VTSPRSVDKLASRRAHRGDESRKGNPSPRSQSGKVQRTIDASANRPTHRSQFVRCNRSQLMSQYTEDWWRRFLEDYVATVNTCIAEHTDSPVDALAPNISPATDDEIHATEYRLSVQFPPSIRSFYRVSNGWPSDGWLTPPVCSLPDLDFLEISDNHLFRLAVEVENITKPFRKDPDGTRLAEYKLESGTRVKRSLSICNNPNDSYTVLVDPMFREDEWPCGMWAHWIPGMSWCADSFAQYMTDRLKAVLMLLREG
jgi:cell wall assembly regulator SMI1